MAWAATRISRTLTPQLQTEVRVRVLQAVRQKQQLEVVKEDMLREHFQ